MLPRRSTSLVAAADEAPRDALTVLPLALPRLLALRIWVSLPCDLRLRCREVCPAWRDALAEPRLWSEVDLTETSGVEATLTPALLRAATARASGQLERLLVAYDWQLQAALLAVVVANASALRLLRLEHFEYELCADLLRAASRQCVVEADVLRHVRYAYVGPILRNEDPFQAVRVRKLRVGCHHMLAADVAAFVAELAAHPSLRELSLVEAPLDTFAALDALVDAALTLRLHTLALIRCEVAPTNAVALPRLLHDGDALRELTVWSGTIPWAPLLDAHAASLLADALRSNRALKSLTLGAVHLWDDVEAAATMFGALIGHATLTSIVLSFNVAGGAAAAVGALLGTLVAADSPLRLLSIRHNELGDAGMGPLVNALPQNTHLTELQCCQNRISAAFARDQLLPALAANASLRQLDSDSNAADAFIAGRTMGTAAAARA